MDTVNLAVEAGIATITFSNPPKGFLTSAMLMALADLLDQVEQDESVRAVIFTGGLPDVFIRHFAVEEILSISQVLQAQQAKGLPAPRMSRTPLRGVWERIDNFPKPTIAAINGVCGGGGCELALCCDIRLAGSGDYRIGQMEILVGILPGAGGTVRLARAVGTARALEWVLRGRTFTPQEAAEQGLVHHYIEGDVVAAARGIAREFLDKPPAALAYIKRVMRSGYGRSLQDGLDEESDLFATLIADDARAIEMMTAYVEGGHQLPEI